MQSAISSHSGLKNLSGSLQESLPARIGLVVAATALVALCAHVSLPLPFTPVPITLQNFAVILIGMVLGPVAGFSAMVLYLAEGAMGMPVFSPHGLGGVAQLMGPTGGYLFSYPLAAAAAGWVVRAMRNAGTRFGRAVVAGVVANIIIFAVAVTWMAHLLHLSAATAWTLAAVPFLPGEVIKVIAAAGVFSGLQRWQKS